MLESMLTVAYEQYVIDDEIIGMCCKVLKGIKVEQAIRKKYEIRF